MQRKLLAILTIVIAMSACGAFHRNASDRPGAISPGPISLGSTLPSAPPSTPDPWTPYGVEKGMGAQWCPEDPNDDSGRTRYGGLNRACLGLLPRHLAEVLVAIPTEHIFLPTDVRAYQARRSQPYLALPGRGKRPDFMASIDILEGIQIRSFEGTQPSDTVYLVIGPFKCIDHDRLIAREGEYLVETEACKAAHAEPRLYRWSRKGSLRDVTREYLPAPAITQAEQALTAPFVPYLETTRLERAPVMRWTIYLKDASPPGRADDHDYDPVPMPDWVPKSRRLGSGLHLGFAVWNGKNFELRQRVPRALWPLPSCDPLRPDVRCRAGNPAQGRTGDPFVDEDDIEQTRGGNAMTNPHPTNASDIDIRAVADRVIAQMRQGQPDQGLHLLPKRPGERGWCRRKPGFGRDFFSAYGRRGAEDDCKRKKAIFEKLVYLDVGQ